MRRPHIIPLDRSIVSKHLSMLYRYMYVDETEQFVEDKDIDGADLINMVTDMFDELGLYPPPKAYHTTLEIES